MSPMYYIMYTIISLYSEMHVGNKLMLPFIEVKSHVKSYFQCGPSIICMYVFHGILSCAECFSKLWVIRWSLLFLLCGYLLSWLFKGSPNPLFSGIINDIYLHCLVSLLRKYGPIFNPTNESVPAIQKAAPGYCL